MFSTIKAKLKAIVRAWIDKIGRDIFSDVKGTYGERSTPIESLSEEEKAEIIKLFETIENPTK